MRLAAARDQKPVVRQRTKERAEGGERIRVRREYVDVVVGCRSEQDVFCVVAKKLRRVVPIRRRIFIPFKNEGRTLPEMGVPFEPVGDLADEVAWVLVGGLQAPCGQ